MRSKLLPPLIAAAFTAAILNSLPALQAQQTSIGQPLAKEAVLSVLTSKLDTKRSRVGDPVTARTLNPLRLDDGKVLPAGSTLAGKVTQVQPKSGGGAMLAINFDRVAMKGSDPMAVHGLVVAVAPAPSMADSGGSTADLPLGSGGDSKGRMTAATGTGINDAKSALPPIQAGSGIKGVVLNPTPAADGSSVLQSTEKDIRLESGTRLEIGLMAVQ